MPTHEIHEEKKVIINWLRRLGMEFQTGFIVLNTELENHPIIYANQSFLEMSGYEEEEVLGQNGKFMHGSKTDKRVGQKIRNCMESKKAGIFEIVNYRKDGLPFWNEITIQPIIMHETDFTFTIMLQRDITDRKRAEALINLQQQIHNDMGKGYLLSFLLQKACDTVESFFKDDTKCTVLFVNDAGYFQVGAGKSMPSEFHDKVEQIQSSPVTGTCGAAFHTNQTVIVEDMKASPLWNGHQYLVEELHLTSSWSVPIDDANDKAIGTFGIYFTDKTLPTEEDIAFVEQIGSIVSLTVRYSQQQEEILRLAYTDKETALPNRNYFINELKELLDEKKEGFVAFVSADEYIKVVDQYGHTAGDALIREIGKRFLRAGMSANHVIARFSDSTIALVNLNPLGDVPAYLEKLSQCVIEPTNVQDMELFLTLKMGVALITPKQQDEKELIRYADSALSKAKLRAGESICYFENEHDDFMMRDLRIANELSAALRREEIDVHLQPKVDLKSGKIISFEALARWNSPELGSIAPDVFIPAAEKNGKIRLLEQVVFKRVLTWLKKRKELGLELRQVAVNISADHFFHHSFIPHLVDRMAEYGIEHKWIQLEITERIGFVDIETAHQVFKKLNRYGFTSSVDDFGTGYSSLSYLQKLPVSEIKIDRSFISNMHEHGTLAIVRTIIQLAENLNMTAVAEGIETEQQRSILVSLGCRVGQGYFYYRPMSLEEANLL
ncbi:EAL domain-containing protein [Planococcus ruber]|uniref:EAL domain-containing protein n=1 Tax=Planococcus ruber TaxID=2027871 RepID=UPI001FED5E2A|nr:EAL domain-containing protein [Planococcus ruber]MCJ1908183.1 EAL domain-containing protein [Planococcus ruber]